MEQLKLVDIHDEFQFKTVLRTNFAKSRMDQSKFDQLYHLFFYEMESNLSAAAEKSPEQLGMEAVIHMMEKELAGDDLDTSLMDFLSGNPLNYIGEVQAIHNREEKAAKALKSNMGQLSSRLEVMLKINRLKAGAVKFMGGNHANIDDSLKAAIENQINTRLESAYNLLNKEPRPDNAGLQKFSGREKHFNTIGEIPFSNLSKRETKEVRDIINKLVRKLEEITTLRYATNNKGVMDVKKTIRNSGKYLGIPIEIKYKNKPLRKGKIVTLCDVSGSVWSTARFMLNILYSLQICFSKVKSYIFISDMTEITEYFVEYNVNDAIKKIMNNTDINYNSMTDYGMAFQHFKNRHLNELDKKTTLIIIGDARSNYMNPQEFILKKMRERCRRVIWLNPEQEQFWSAGDSEIYTYKTYCNEVRACGNLNQLVDFIEALII
ncbi:MAG: VWA domain-containing protein [Desulfamplus sp.]|nr:VWA domain-containing protein [Desulfamplus sp.]